MRENNWTKVCIPHKERFLKIPPHNLTMYLENKNQEEVKY